MRYIVYIRACQAVIATPFGVPKCNFGVAKRLDKSDKKIFVNFTRKLKVGLE